MLGIQVFVEWNGVEWTEDSGRPRQAGFFSSEFRYVDLETKAQRLAVPKQVFKQHLGNICKQIEAGGFFIMV